MDTQQRILYLLTFCLFIVRINTNINLSTRLEYILVIIREFRVNGITAINHRKFLKLSVSIIQMMTYRNVCLQVD